MCLDTCGVSGTVSSLGLWSSDIAGTVVQMPRPFRRVLFRSGFIWKALVYLDGLKIEETMSLMKENEANLSRTVHNRNRTTAPSAFTAVQ